jgi:hypothetical protein
LPEVLAKPLASAENTPPLSTTRLLRLIETVVAFGGKTTELDPIKSSAKYPDCRARRAPPTTRILLVGLCVKVVFVPMFPPLSISNMLTDLERLTKPVSTVPAPPYTKPCPPNADILPRKRLAL